MSWDRRRWTNWSGIQSVAPARHHDPDSLGELVALVREAESGTPPRRVRAVARGWAFSAVAVTADYLVETARLNRTLYDVLPRAFGAGRSADSERLLPNPGASATSRQGSPGTSCPCDWTRRPAWSSTPVPGNRRPPSLGTENQCRCQRADARWSSVHRNSWRRAPPGAARRFRARDSSDTCHVCVQLDSAPDTTRPDTKRRRRSRGRRLIGRRPVRPSGGLSCGYLPPTSPNGALLTMLPTGSWG